MNFSSLSTSIERIADREPDVSLREMLTRIWVRPWLFWLCVIVPPFVAMGFTALVPPTYKATVKMLIRYSASESAFLRDLIPDNRAALSGNSSAEILKSLPSLTAVVREQHIEDADIARSPGQVVSGRIAGWFGRVFPHGAEAGDAATGAGAAGGDAETLRVARALKDSLEDASGGAAKSKPIEVLDKSGNLPAAMRGDELISVVVSSFNRRKVADMANGLASAFIAEYARLSAEDARRSTDFLDRMILDAERGATPRSAGGRQGGGVAQAGNGRTDPYRQSPLLDGISTELANRQVELARLGSMYSANAPAVVAARAAVESIRASLAATEGREMAKLDLEQLRTRRYQARNTEQLFRDGIVPISVVEAAVTPEPSGSSALMRYATSGAVGLALGTLLGLGLVLTLSLADQRIHTAWDAERALQLPLLGALPLLSAGAARRKARFGCAGATGVLRRFLDSAPGLSRRHSPLARAQRPGTEDAFLRLLGRLDGSSRRGPCLTIAVASAEAGDGKTFVLAGLASMLSRGGSHRVLLVDADLHSQGLSKTFDADDRAGLVEAIRSDEPVARFVRPDVLPGVDLLPSGNVARRASLGFYRAGLQQRLAAVRPGYDFMLIDTAAALESSEVLMCAPVADAVLWVVSAGSSRRPLVRTALDKLRESGIVPVGVVLNRRRSLVPGWIWRHV